LNERGQASICRCLMGPAQLLVRPMGFTVWKRLPPPALELQEAREGIDSDWPKH
jgi:hypothetical protein